MMTTIGYIAAGLIVFYLLVRFAFPQQFFDFLIGLIRRLCGLRRHSVDAGGLTWHYLEGGNPDAEPLVLLHGFGGDKDNWPIYARYFTKSYRIIVPDLPGFGESKREMDADYTISAQTQRLYTFAQTLGLSRVHLAGNSMGGFLALKYALTYPDEVLTLTLFNAAGVAGENQSELEIRAEKGESPLTVSSLEEFEQLLQMIFYRPLPLPGIAKRVLGKQAIERREFLERIFWSLYNEILNQPLNDQLAEIRAPTLVVWGRHDRIIDVSCADVMAASIPINNCIVFEETGHVSMIERHSEAAKAQLRYMADSSPA